MCHEIQAGDKTHSKKSVSSTIKSRTRVKNVQSLIRILVIILYTIVRYTKPTLGSANTNWRQEWTSAFSFWGKWKIVSQSWSPHLLLKNSQAQPKYQVFKVNLSIFSVKYWIEGTFYWPKSSKKCTEYVPWNSSRG